MLSSSTIKGEGDKVTMQLSASPTENKIKILVADDNESDRMILSSIIIKQGHEVLTASDGKEALAIF